MDISILEKPIGCFNCHHFYMYNVKVILTFVKDLFVNCAATFNGQITVTKAAIITDKYNDVKPAYLALAAQSVKLQKMTRVL